MAAVSSLPAIPSGSIGCTNDLPPRSSDCLTLHINMGKLCEHDGCTKQSHYNTPGERAGRFCAAHKLGGMVNVGSKACEHDGCTKLPSFNNPGEKGGRFCAAHKLGGMVNVRDKVCEHDGCTNLPSFNNPGERTGRYCAAHKLGGMVNMVTKRAAAVRDGTEGLMLLAGNKRRKNNE